MPDVQELSDNDMSVAERMKELPDSVLFGEEVEDTKAGRERDDDPDAPDEIRDGPETEEVEAEVADKQAKESDAEGEADPEFEIPDPDGGEARKVKLSELLEAEREFIAFKDEKAAILTRVQTEATQAAQGMVQQTREAMTGIGYQLQAVMQVLQPPQPPQPPPPEVTSQYSPRYDPDAVQNYLLAKANHEQAMGRFNAVQQTAKGLQSQLQAMDEQRDEREFQRLTPHWPEFTDPVKGQATQSQFMEAMNKAYGYTPQELDASLTDYRNALVARDALKWREHEAKAKTAKTSLKEKVVTTQKPAKQGVNQASGRTLTADQSAYMNARKALKANGKDTHALAKGFMRFL